MLYGSNRTNFEKRFNLSVINGHLALCWAAKCHSTPVSFKEENLGLAKISQNVCLALKEQDIFFHSIFIFLFLILAKYINLKSENRVYNLNITPHQQRATSLFFHHLCQHELLTLDQI